MWLPYALQPTAHHTTTVTSQPTQIAHTMAPMPVSAAAHEAPHMTIWTALTPASCMQPFRHEPKPPNSCGSGAQPQALVTTFTDFGSKFVLRRTSCRTRAFSSAVLLNCW